MLHKNVGNVDKTIRFIASVILIVWMLISAPIFGSNIITGLVGFFALVNAVTALFSVCIVYSLFDLSTLRNAK